MEKLILVFIGGGLGSLARYGVGVAYGPVKWPYNTFTVNVLGGLVMGLVVGWLALRGGTDQERWRVLLGVGVLGGFTTFSSFSLETALMIERKAYATAAGYIALSVVLAISALFVGLYIARRVFT